MDPTMVKAALVLMFYGALIGLGLILVSRLFRFLGNGIKEQERRNR